MPLLQSAPLRAPSALQPLLTPEQINQESSSLLGAGLSGLSWVGDSLDTITGARAIRAGLQGLSGGEVNPFELLTFGPFGTITDALGLTSRKGIVTPNDLAVQWGMGENKPGLDWNDARDLGIGILLDPATYLTGGLSAAGKAAKAAGVFPKALRTAEGALQQGVRSQSLTSSLDDIMRGAGPEVAARIEQAAGGADNLAKISGDPLRHGIFGVKLPFQKYMGLGDEPLASFGGERLGSSLDSFFDRVRYGAVPGQEATNLGGKALDAVGAGVRNLAPLVSKPLQGATTRMGQIAAADNWEELEPLIASGRKEVADDVLSLQRAGAMQAPKLSDILRTGIEMGPEQMKKLLGATGENALMADDPVKAVDDLLRGRLAKAGLNDEQIDVATGVMGRMRDRYNSMKNMEQGAWLKTEELDDWIGYVARQPTLPRGAKRSTNSVYNARHPYQGQRSDDVRGVATETLNDISIDPVVSGKNRTAADYVEAAAHIEASYGVDAAKAKELARWARKLDPIHAETGSKAYDNDIFVDYFKRQQAGAEATAAGNTVKKLLKELAGEDGDVKISAVLNKAGMSAERAAAEMGDDWLNLRVDRATADEIGRVMKPFTSPDEVNKLVDLIIDRPTNFFRATVTAPFPAFHSRNWVSGQAINYVIGGLSWKSMKDSWKLIRGKEIEGAADFPMFQGKGLTDAQATDEIRKLMFAHQLSGPGQMQGLSSAAEGVAGSNVLDSIPGITPATGIWGALKKAVPQSLAEANPVNTAGVATEGDVFAPVVAGRQFGETVEGMNRGTPFIEFLRKGMNPTEAAARVKAAHVDYSSLTQFERRFARRIMPFYSFASRMLPWTLRNLIDEPAGMVRQSARAANIMAGEDQGLLPAHIQSRFTIPIGEEDAEGNQKFFQGIDLPWESTFDLFRGGPTTFGTVKNTLGGLIGQMNPLLRAPLEIGSGYDFFSGRRLEDVDSTLGRIGSNITGADEPYYVDPLIEKGLQGVGGGLNRALTMGRQLGDDRKTWTDLGINFLTGAKITDQPMDRQRSIAARDLISESLRGQPGARTFEHLYVPQDRMHLLSPENQRRYLLYRSLAAEAQRKAREKKAEESN